MVHLGFSITQRDSALQQWSDQECCLRGSSQGVEISELKQKPGRVREKATGRLEPGVCLEEPKNRTPGLAALTCTQRVKQTPDLKDLVL